MSTLGVSFIRFGVDDIPNTTDLIDQNGNIDYDRITSFSAADQAFLIDYARKLGVPGLRLGGNAKIIYRRVGSSRMPGASVWTPGCSTTATAGASPPWDGTSPAPSTPGATRWTSGPSRCSSRPAMNCRPTAWR